MTIKKIFCFLICIFCVNFVFSAELKAKQLAEEAARKENVDDSISYLKTQIEKLTDLTEKRSSLIYLAGIQEQILLFDDAQKTYAQAAGISAGDADGMPKKTNQELVLSAIRCALCAGDWQSADSYLNSSIRNSKNQNVISYINLYTQWSALSRAESVDQIQEPVIMLQTYAKLESMKNVRPSILLTLWYVTGDKSYSEELKKQFPSSLETSIVNGDIQLLPTPFWFFVPKSGTAETGTGTYSETSGNNQNQNVTTTQKQNDEKSVADAQNSENQRKSEESNSVPSKLQLGLFKTESNAKLLSDEVNSKGFKSYITSEKRASGTTYYIVIVDDDSKGSVAERLRSSGYECYALE
jgi:hypothetical protein